MGRVEVFKNTSEDWYPSYKLDGGRSSPTIGFGGVQLKSCEDLDKSLDQE